MNFIEKIALLLLLITVQAYNQACSQIFINEFMAANRNAHWDNSLKDYSDWIELHNAGNKPVDLSGYYITDNFNQETKWVLPDSTTIEANGFLLLWADNSFKKNHLGFALNMYEEEIGLYTPSLELVDQVEYSGQVVNVSYGRCIDAGKEWCYFGEHSAGVSNGRGKGATTRDLSGDVLVSLNGGAFNEKQRIELSGPGIIRYTLNGAEVTYHSAVYKNPIAVDSTIVIRAKAYEPGKLPGITQTFTYLINEPHDLPILSLSTDPGNLWDIDRGIYVLGRDATEEDWRKANYRQLWHRPAYIEYYGNGDNMGFASSAEIKVFGSFTSRYGQKPLTLYFEKGETPTMNIFRSRGITPYHSLVLRNSGQDWIRTLICDGLFSSLVIDVLDVDAQAYRPLVLYINGEYWGIHNIREKVNEEHFGNLYDIDPSRILLQKRLRSTGQDEMDSLLEYVTSHDLSEQVNMKRVSEFMEVDEFLNYTIAEFYSANMDWPKNNVRMWKKMGPEGKWRWILVDLDVSMGIWGNARFDANSLSRILDSATVNTELFRALMQNRRFKDDFIQRSALLLNTVFEEQRVNHFIDSLSGNIAAEMPRHIERWKDSCSWSCGLGSMGEWNKFLNDMRFFANNRPRMMRDHFRERFDLGKDIRVVFEAKHGKIVVNHCDIPINPSGLYFEHSSLTLTAIPDPGYEFDTWYGILLPNGGNTQEIQTNIVASTIRAGFKPTELTELSDVISEDTVLSKLAYPYFLSKDLTVDSGVTLTLEAGITVLIGENTNILVHGSLMINGTAESPVTFEANSHVGSKSWGALSFEDSYKKSVLNHLIVKDATHGLNRKRQLAAINSFRSEVEMNWCTINEVKGQPIYAEYSKTAISNCILQTHINSDIINLKYGVGLVEECDLKGNFEPNSDGIDYDDMTASSILNNHIYNFLGFNSDGIDLGEGVVDVLVEGNHIFNCSDRGISVVQGTTARIIRNLIVSCSQGVGIKDKGSYALINQNIFYKNGIGVACFEKTFGRGGGKAKVTNCVFSKSIIAGVKKDKLSKLKVSYSISDVEILKGYGNAYESPRFINPEMGDFSVYTGSPCTNEGEYFSVLDLREFRSYGDRMLSKKLVRQSVINLLILCVLALITSTAIATFRRP